MKKHILMLANAIRNNPCWCAAGREVKLRKDQYAVGRWIRIVGTHGHSELNHYETMLPDGTQPNVMDFVEVPVAAPIGDILQPENWIMGGQRNWRRINPLYGEPDATSSNVPTTFGSNRETVLTDSHVNI